MGSLATLVPALSASGDVALRQSVPLNGPRLGGAALRLFETLSGMISLHEALSSSLESLRSFGLLCWTHSGGAALSLSEKDLTSPNSTIQLTNKTGHLCLPLGLS